MQFILSDYMVNNYSLHPHAHYAAFCCVPSVCRHHCLRFIYKNKIACSKAVLSFLLLLLGLPYPSTLLPQDVSITKYKKRFSDHHPRIFYPTRFLIRRYWLIHYFLKLCKWFDGYTASIDDDFLSKFPYLENVIFL